MKGITKKWVIDVVSIVVVVMLIVSVALIFIVQRSYYSTVETVLDSNSGDMINTFFTIYSSENSKNFAMTGRAFIEDFSKKDSMEVWIINSNGEPILSSSGFGVSPTYMPDYDMAINSETQTAVWKGENNNGEKILAKTVMISYSDGVNAGAVRFMVSLQDIDRQLINVSLLIALACLAFLVLFVLISARFVFRSVIRPVRSASETASQIAGGDLKARIENFSDDDEIGDLCKTINNMAEELEKADSMKNDFISTVSHELRTPLTAIKGWGETLLQLGDIDPAMSKRGMEIIIDETGRLNGMVEELLDFSRINNGAMKLNIEMIDLLAELDEIVFTFRDRAAKEGIELLYSVPQFPVPAHGDAARIRQVFINILDNAFKYNHQGGKVSVTAEIRTPGSVSVTVADTGKGISKEDLPNVREKFYKADYTVRGSGIGLAVVDEIIKLHNGEFEIDSVLGEGTVVTVTFPTEVVNPEEGVSINEQQ